MEMEKTFEVESEVNTIGVESEVFMFPKRILYVNPEVGFTSPKVASKHLMELTSSTFNTHNQVFDSCKDGFDAIALMVKNNYDIVIIYNDLQSTMSAVDTIRIIHSIQQSDNKSKEIQKEIQIVLIGNPIEELSKQDHAMINKIFPFKQPEVLSIKEVLVILKYVLIDTV